MEKLRAVIDQLSQDLEIAKETKALGENDKSPMQKSGRELESEAHGNKTAVDNSTQDIINCKNEISLLNKELGQKDDVMRMKDNLNLKKEIVLQNLKTDDNDKEEKDSKSERNVKDIEATIKELNEANEKIQNLEILNCLNNDRIQTPEKDVLMKDSEIETNLETISNVQLANEFKIEKLLREIDNKEREIKESNQKIQNLENLECSNAKKIQNLETLQRSNAEKIQNLETLQRSNAEKIQTLNKSISTKDTAIQRILHTQSTEKVEHDSTVESLLNDIESKDKEIRDSDTKLLNMETRINLNADLIETLEKRISEKEKKMNDVSETLSREKADNESLTSKLEKELDSKNREVDECRGKIKSLETQIILKDNRIMLLTDVEVIVKSTKETNTDDLKSDDLTIEAKSDATKLEAELKHCYERIQVKNVTSILRLGVSCQGLRALKPDFACKLL